MKTPGRTRFGAVSCSLSIALLTGAVAAPNVSSVQDYLGPQFRPAQGPASRHANTATVATTAADVLAHWNQIAIDASGLDHTPVAAGGAEL